MSNNMTKIIPDSRRGEQIALLSAGAVWMPLLDRLQDVNCWVKDREGRFVAVNAALALAAGLGREKMVGKSDADLYAQEFAAMYHRDDLAVLNGGRAILDKPELIHTAPGEFEWRLTSKIPVRDAAGRIVGTAGISRRMASVAALPGQTDALGGLIRYARENIARRITVRGLAAHAKLSVATLERRIQATLGTTPRRFLAEIRLNEAARLLTGSALNVAEVADRAGYESPASFTRAFRRRHGVAPGVFRNQGRRDKE
ncbi:MAG: AraC family transcriptional regulator [Burkholderiales bacterium]|nr:AraC family transcriptional regulator [Opitutaceae bacterium]